MCCKANDKIVHCVSIKFWEAEFFGLNRLKFQNTLSIWRIGKRQECDKMFSFKKKNESLFSVPANVKCLLS